MEASILGVVQNGKFFNLFKGTAIFRKSPMLF
jgi:hypothetical protein